MTEDFWEGDNKAAVQKKAGFISGTLLSLLLLCISVSLILGNSLSITARTAKSQKDALEAMLAYEETLLRLDLGLARQSYTNGLFSVDCIEESPKTLYRVYRVRLMDGSHILEETWVNIAR